MHGMANIKCSMLMSGSPDSCSHSPDFEIRPGDRMSRGFTWSLQAVLTLS